MQFRTSLKVPFFIHDGQMVLVHGFIKKTQQTPDQELDLAVKRKKEIENDGKTKGSAFGLLVPCRRLTTAKKSVGRVNQVNTETPRFGVLRPRLASAAAVMVFGLCQAKVQVF
jgi:hypothetical protein